MHARLVFGVALVCALLGSIDAAHAGVSLQGFAVEGSAPKSGPLITVDAQGVPSNSGEAAVWIVTVNLTQLSTLPPSIVLNFPDRAAVTLTRDQSQQRGPGAFLWSGRGDDCSAVLREAPASFQAEISCMNASYEVISAPNSTGRMVRAGAASITQSANDFSAGPPPAVPNMTPQAPTGGAPDTDVEVLVLYTEAVRQALDPAGGTSNTNLLAQDAVDLTQQAMINSTPAGQATIAQVKLLSAIEVARTADGDLDADLRYLAGDPEPMALRNFWAADIVMYLTDRGGPGGAVGYSNIPEYGGFSAPGPGYAPYAEAAVQFDCIKSVPPLDCPDIYVFSHEFGHIFGGNHDHEDAPNPYPPPGPVRPWAFAHWAHNNVDGGGARTLLSYYLSACDTVAAACPRILNYSDAQVTELDWFRTGVANQQENARVIQEFAPVTAQYRISLGRIFYNGFDGVQ